MDRPWGTYTALQEGPHFKIKRIEVKPGASLSLQMHHHRSEHWVVVSGTGRVTVDDKVVLLAPNESTYVPVGARPTTLSSTVTRPVPLAPPSARCGGGAFAATGTRRATSMRLILKCASCRVV